MGAADRPRAQAHDRRTTTKPSPRHRFDLLYVDGTLAALIETIREADHLLVENVAVSPSFQGRGLGRKLMAHAETLAHELGFGTIRLYTNQRFVENIALYRRLGYQVDREEVVPVGVVTHMSKKPPRRQWFRRNERNYFEK